VESSTTLGPAITQVLMPKHRSNEALVLHSYAKDAGFWDLQEGRSISYSCEPFDPAALLNTAGRVFFEVSWLLMQAASA
jgi:hypothetical protein